MSDAAIAQPAVSQPQAETNVVLDPNINNPEPQAEVKPESSQEQQDLKVPGELKADVPKPEPKKYKLKVAGQELELPEEEVVRRAQLAEGSDAKFKEAKKLRDQAELLFNALQKDPLAVLTDPKLGYDSNKLEKAFEDWYIKRQQEASMSPAERAQVQKDQELARYKALEAQRHQQMQAKMRADMEAKIQADISSKIQAALQTEGIPKNERTVARMAEKLAQQTALGLDLNPQQLSHLVREEYINEIQALVSNSTGEQIVKLLGEDLVNKIHKYDLERLRAAHAPSVPVEPAPAPVQQNQGNGYKSMKEFQEYMAKNFGVNF